MLLPTDTHDQDLVTPEDAVRELGGAVTAGTLRNWRSLGGGPPYTRIGRRVFYTRTALRDFVSRRTYNHTAEERARKVVATLGGDHA